jgi:hypothetical protein
VAASTAFEAPERSYLTLSRAPELHKRELQVSIARVRTTGGSG